MERPPIGHRRLEVAAFTSSFVLYPYPRPTPRVSRFGSEDPFHLSAPAPRCALGLPVAGRPRAQRAEHPRARSCPGAIPSPAACGPRSSCASPGGSGLRPARGTGQPLGLKASDKVISTPDFPVPSTVVSTCYVLNQCAKCPLAMLRNWVSSHHLMI